MLQHAIGYPNKINDGQRTVFGITIQ